MRAAIFAMALGAFAIGLTEFAVMGLLPQVATDLRASAVGWLFLGLTVANLVGVPAATVFGGVVGWRPAFALIAGVALLCGAGMLLTVPRDAGAGGVAVGLRAELAVFRRPAVLLALAMVVFGCGGLFTFSTYIAPMTTEVTGWSPTAVPVMLALLGLGMTAGTFLAAASPTAWTACTRPWSCSARRRWCCSVPSPRCTHGCSPRSAR